MTICFWSIGGVQFSINLIAGKRVDDVEGAPNIEKPFHLSCSKRPIESATLQAIKSSCVFVLPRTLMILPVAWLKVSTAAVTVTVGISDRFAKQAFGAIGIDLETKNIAAKFTVHDHVAGPDVWIRLKFGHVSPASDQSTETTQAASLVQPTVRQKKNDETNDVYSSPDSLFKKQDLKKVVVTGRYPCAPLIRTKIEVVTLADRLHLELREKEAKDVGLLFDPFAQRRADAVAGAGRCAQTESDGPNWSPLAAGPSSCANGRDRRGRRSRRS